MNQKRLARIGVLLGIALIGLGVLKFLTPHPEPGCVRSVEVTDEKFTPKPDTDRIEAIMLVRAQESGPFISSDARVDSIAAALHAIRERFPHARVREPADRRIIDVGIKAATARTVAKRNRRIPTGRFVCGFTGYEPLDSLLSLFPGTRISGEMTETDFSMITVILSDALAVRFDSLGNLFEALPGVELAMHSLRMGDGGGVRLRFMAGSWEFTFRHGWGDCPAGCTRSHVDVFNYDPRTGAIALVRETGPPIPAPGTEPF